MVMSSTATPEHIRRERQKINHLRYAIREQLVGHYGYQCACCRKYGKVTIDHVVPLAQGGTSDLNNLQLLCNRCNHRKNDKTVDYRSDADRLKQWPPLDTLLKRNFELQRSRFRP